MLRSFVEQNWKDFNLPSSEIANQKRCGEIQNKYVKKFWINKQYSWSKKIAFCFVKRHFHLFMLQDDFNDFLLPHSFHHSPVDRKLFYILRSSLRKKLNDWAFSLSSLDFRTWLFVMDDWLWSRWPNIKLYSVLEEKVLYFSITSRLKRGKMDDFCFF